MRILRIQPGFVTNHSNPVSTYYYVLVKGSLENKDWKFSMRNLEGCERCSESDSCSDAGSGIGRISMKNCDYKEIGRYKYVLNQKNRCQNYSMVGCLMCKISEKIRAKVKKVNSGEYFLTIARAYADSQACLEGAPPEFMQHIAQSALKRLIMGFPTCEVVGCIEDRGEGYIEPISFSWVEEWFKHRILYFLYILIEGKLNEENPVGAKFRIGGIAEDCLLIENLMDRDHLEKMMGQLNEEQLKKIDEGKYSLISICGYNYREGVEPRVERAKKYAEEGLKILRKNHKVLKLMGGSVFAGTQNWDLEEKELPQNEK